MSSLLRVREYAEAAKRARYRAKSERTSQAKQILQEIERSYHRLVEIEKWMLDQHNHPFAYFGMFNGRDAATVFTSARADRVAFRQIKTGAIPKEHYRKGDHCER